MPNLLAKPPAFKPPVNQAHINWNHVLADGLLWLVMPGDDHRQEMVNGGIGTLQTNMSWHGASPIGSAAASSSGANSGIYYPLSSANRLTQLAEQWTMAGWWRIDATTSFEHFFCLPNTTTGWSSPFGWITFQRNSTGDSGRVQMQGAISGSINSASGYLLTDGQFHHYAVVGRTSTGNLEWWRDGKLLSTSTAALSGNASIPTPVQTPIVMGRQGPGGDNTAESCQGSMAMFGIWKRAMPAAAVQRLYSHPFSFLRATTPRYRAYVSQSTVSATAASTLPSVTQAAAGTVTKPTYTGTASSALPSLTQSATGTVTQPVYTGTAASVLPSLTQAASGTFTKPVYTGTATSTLPSLTQTATGTATPPTFTATTASTLLSVTQAAVGTFTDSTAPIVKAYLTASVAAERVLVGASSATRLGQSSSATRLRGDDA